MQGKHELLKEANIELDKQKYVDIVLKACLSSIRKFNEEKEADIQAEDIEEAILELIEKGIVIKRFVNRGRRLAFECEFEGRQCVVKFAMFQKDRIQNINENRIYSDSVINGDQSNFAEVLYLTKNSTALVQEFCTHFEDVSEYTLPKFRWFTRYMTEEELTLPQDEFKSKVKERVSELKEKGKDLDLEVKYKLYEIQTGKTADGRIVYVDYGV